MSTTCRCILAESFPCSAWERSLWCVTKNSNFPSKWRIPFSLPKR